MPTKHSLGKQAKGVNFNRVKGYAQKMRDNPTPAEAEFHKHLKQTYLGHISTQHHFVGRKNAFILDFYLPEKKIAFEIDGWHHYNDPKQIAKDKFRDNYCRVHGIKIVRLKNHEAINKSLAQSTILKAIGASRDMIRLAESEISTTIRLRKRMTTDTIGPAEIKEAIDSLPTAKTFDNIDDLIVDLNQEDQPQAEDDEQ